MKKIILNSLITVMAFGGVVASAETSGTVPATTLRNQIRTTKAEAREDIKEIRENTASTTRELRNDLKEIIKNKIEKRFGKMFDRFQSTIDRETAIMAKLNTRIAKIKANGGTTTEAEKVVAEAKVHIDEAQKDLNALKVIANNDNEIASSTTDRLSKETLASMKDSAKEIEKHLREAHQDLQKSIGILRGVSQLKNASSTKETSN